MADVRTVGWAKPPIAAFLGLAAVLVVVVWSSAELLPTGEGGTSYRPVLDVADDVLGPWLRWDADTYEDIALHGYREADRAVYDAGGESRIAYFPGYPLVARGVGEVLGDLALAMVLVTFVSGLGVVVLFSRWARDQTSDTSGGWAVVALLVFPWTYFLVATGYGDALFLLATIAAFVLMEADRPLAATASGVVATLTRPVGAAVTVGLVLLAIQRHRERSGADSAATVLRSWLRDRAFVVVGSIGGLVAFMAYCWAEYGHPLAFSIAQRGWGQEPGPRTWFKLTFLDVVRGFDDPSLVARLTIHAVVGLVFVAAIPAVWKRFGPAYGAYTALVVLIPFVGSAWFASLGRYMLAAFPAFALLGEHLQRWAVGRRWLYVAGSAAGLVLNASFWARGYWMG